jgi:thiol:disulfide interchange protein DsbD
MKRIFAVLLALFSLTTFAAEGDFLDPEQAFKLSVRALDANTIELRYRIADGYYMYRERFKFQAQPVSVTLGTPGFPPGKVKEDANFGRVETYRQDLVIKLPVVRSTTGEQAVTLKVTAQGCADAGLCYNPFDQVVSVNLPSTAATSSVAPVAGSALASLKNLVTSFGGTAENEFLPPDQAFKLNVSVRDINTLVADFEVVKDYYLYRDKAKFTVQGNPGVSIVDVVFPQADEKVDKSFGKMAVYHQPFKVLIKLKRDVGAADKFVLAATYQGCSEKGICYPPLNKTYDLSLAGAPAAVATSTPSAANGSGLSESLQIANLFKGGSFWLIIAGFFGFGLLLSLTPCVFPMIPILSGIIVGQGKSVTKAHGFVLSVVYVLGMAITYALAGVAAGLSGSLLSAALQNPWVLGSFALVFVVLSFSMFGFYELQMPAALQSKFSDTSNKMKGGSFVGVFIMGSLSALICGPCVAAPLAGALLYIGQTHNVWLGGSALFAMALGMGVPLLLVGLSAGALMPRAGGWMTAVKSFFGVLLLAVAIWLISPVIPVLAHMLLWSALLIVSAIYLRALDPLPVNASGFVKFWKGVGIISLVVGAALLIGALSGGRDILQPLTGLRAGGITSPAAAAETGPKFERIKSVAELEARIQQANGRHVMLDFYADWCVSCKEMERFTFADPKVQAKLANALLLQADVTANSADDKALLKKFSLFGPPGIIFFDNSGNEIPAARVVGYQTPEKFLQTLSALAQ